MRILLMHDYTKLIGGASQAFYDVADLLRNKGHAVHVFTLDEYSINKSHPKDQDYQTVYREPKDPSISHFFQKYFSWRLYRNFKQTIKKINPDIIHIHHNLKSTVSILLAAKLSKVPIIHSMHDANLACISSYGVNKKTGEKCLSGSLRSCLRNRCFPLGKFIKHAILWKVRQWVEKNYVDIILCYSKFLMITLSSLGYKNLEYLPYFISLTANKSKKIATQKNQYLLYIGRLIELKGIKYLIEAFQIVTKTFPHLKLIIIGDGPERKKLESYVEELRIKKTIFFTGDLSRNKLGTYYKNSYVFVTPSIGIENSPLTILEAFSFGVPVVASNIGGIPELVKDGKTGYLFEPRNNQDLADKILKILNNPSLAKKMGKYAQALYNKYYDREEHYLQLMKIYENVLYQ